MPAWRCNPCQCHQSTGRTSRNYNCRCPVSCSSLPLHSQLQYVVVEVRASEQPRDGSAAFPWPWTACMVCPVMEPGDGTCSTYACVCLRAAWNCACGTSAVVHAYARLYTYVQHTRAWQRDQCMVCFMYVCTYVHVTVHVPVPLPDRDTTAAGSPDAYAVPPIGSVIRVPASSLASSHA